MPTRLSSPWPTTAARKQVPNLPCTIPRPNIHNHLHPSKKPETISNQTQQEAQKENPRKREEEKLRNDRGEHKPGTSIVDVIKGAHLVQGVVIKKGEIIRPCDAWHGRHYCRGCFLGYGSRTCLEGGYLRRYCRESELDVRIL